MSRRRKSGAPASNKSAPNDGTKWGHLSDAELVREFAAELARRRAGDGPRSLEDIETLSEELGHSSGEEAQAATVAAPPPEDGSPRPCPKCGKPVPVKARNRVRHVLTVAMTYAKALLGEGDPTLPLWEARVRQLIDAPSPDEEFRELLDCLPYATTGDQLAALDKLVGHYRRNAKRDTRSSAPSTAPLGHAACPSGSAKRSKAAGNALTPRFRTGRAGETTRTCPADSASSVVSAPQSDRAPLERPPARMKVVGPTTIVGVTTFIPGQRLEQPVRRRGRGQAGRRRR